MRAEMGLIRRQAVDILLRDLPKCAEHVELSEPAQAFLHHFHNSPIDYACGYGAALLAYQNLSSLFERAIVGSTVNVLAGNYDAADDAMRAYAPQESAAQEIPALIHSCQAWINHCRRTEDICGDDGFEAHFDRKPSAGPFVMLMEQRSGSSLVVTWLNSHPAVMCYPECLVDQRAEAQAEIVRLVALGGCPERIVPYAQAPQYQPISIFTKQHLAACGFKTKLGDVHDRDKLREILRQFGYKIIVLGRDNHLRQAISSLRAERLYRERGVYNVRSGIDTAPRKANVPVKQLLYLAESMYNSRCDLLDYVKTLELPVLYLEYSELNDGQKVMNAVFEFIGVEPAPLISGFERTTPGGLNEVIMNYDQLRKAAAGTRWQEMLERA